MGMDCEEYTIVEVDDLPADHDWMLIDEPQRVTVVFRRGRITATACAEAWAAYRSVMRRRHTPPNFLRWAG